MRWLIPGLALSFMAGCGTMAPRAPLDPASAVGSSHATQTAKEDHDGDHGADHDGDHDDGPLPTDAATVARAATVRVLQNDSLGCESEALGPVDVHKKMENTQQALEALKLRAAAMGAEAVTGVDFEHGEGGHEPTHLSGMAVRCRDLLQGRAFDVIGDIQVKGAMGKEEDAFAELRAKGRAMGADLIRGVSFVHGDGNEGTTVRGTAVRFRKP